MGWGRGQHEMVRKGHTVPVEARQYTPQPRTQTQRMLKRKVMPTPPPSPPLPLTRLTHPPHQRLAAYGAPQPQVQQVGEGGAVEPGCWQHLLQVGSS
jgi:hypothetical protein